MSYYNTQAIVLTSMNYGEADRILTLLTYERGRVRAVVRGARRPRNRFAAMAQPMNLIDAQLSGSGNLENLSQGQLVNNYREIKADLDRLAYAGYLLNLFDLATSGASDVAEVFIMLITALELVQYSDEPEIVRLAVEMKLLTAIGFRPHLDNCILCYERLDNSKPLYYNAIKGGVCCSYCADEKQVMPCDGNCRELLVLLQKTNLDKLSIIEKRYGSKQNEIPTADVAMSLKQSGNILKESLRQALGELPKAIEFLDDIKKH